MLAACHGGDTDAVRYDPVDVFPQIPCAAAGDEGLALRVQAGPDPRHDAAFPVMVRIWPPHRQGFEDVMPTAPLLDRGGALVRVSDPGEGADGHASGGPVGESGEARVAAIRCAVDWVRSDAFPRPVSAVVLTGFSLGGDAVVHAALDAPIDGAVLFEPPLVDQLVMDEPAPADVADPSFTPGTCTLDGGCPFPGRAERLVWSGERLCHDTDGDRSCGSGDPVLRAVPDPDAVAIGMWSREVLAEVAANEATVFADGRPAGWPSAAEADRYWAYRDATAPLVRIRDEGPGRWILVATEVDHVQAGHEHVRIAQEALPHAAWFRLGADAAYVALVGAPATIEIPAGVTVDPDAPGALPEGLDDPLILAAELELADRAAALVWEPDLDSVLR